MLLITSLLHPTSGFTKEIPQGGPVQDQLEIRLPSPRHDSGTSVEKALLTRRSIRKYTEDPLSISEISQILWAAQGLTMKIENPSSVWRGSQWQGGLRTAPSAGALYPLELYLVAGNVDDLPEGVYRYYPSDHKIVRVLEGDRRAQLSKAAFTQVQIATAPAAVVISAVYERTAVKYGERARRYVHIEVGNATQNIYLQAVSLGIGTVLIGAFSDSSVKEVMALPEEESPLGIMPLGRIGGSEEWWPSKEE
ncbi:MAG: SagB/ThcOx family dehydrogenase [Candidatus Marinimicrobia bacterium]|nr:SagB/ThcOx family dehydrogenase [Candidatus Neomarinimicrobiota bacterium]